MAVFRALTMLGIVIQIPILIVFLVYAKCCASTLLAPSSVVSGISILQRKNPDSMR